MNSKQQMRTMRTALLVFGVMITGAVANAAELDELVSNCDGCHGQDGVSQWGDMPTIAGIDAYVHSEALLAYRDSARPCADSEYRSGDTGRAATNMCNVAAELAEADIEALAEYYAGLEFVPAAQAFSSDQADAGKVIHDRACAFCHTEGGANPQDEASILAGQWMGYLERTFAEYRSGERDQTTVMKMAIDALSEDDVAALVHYYASQQ